MAASAWVYTATGRYSAGDHRTASRKGDGVPTEEVLASLGQVYALQGKKQEAEKVLAELMQRSKKTYVSPYLIATIYSRAG